MKLKKNTALYFIRQQPFKYKLKVGSLSNFVLGALCCNFVGLTLSLLLFTLCLPCDGWKNEKRQQFINFLIFSTRTFLTERS